MFLHLAKVHRDVKLLRSEAMKIPSNRGRREPNSQIERNPSPAYASLADPHDRVVPLFDYLYFELYKVETPHVKAFIAPFAACFDRDKAHIGSELDKIGALWGITPDKLFTAAIEALEADLALENQEFDSVLQACEFSYNREATAGEGALGLLMRVNRSFTAKMQEVADLKTQMQELEAKMRLAEAEATKLEALKNRTSLLASVETCLGKRRRDLA